MLCDIHFVRYIEKLVEKANTFEVIKDALNELVDQYRFGEIRIHYSVESNDYRGGGENLDNVVFLERGTIDENNIFEKKYRSEEKGKAVFKLIALKGARPWTDKEKIDLGIILDILFFHLGKCRLMNIVRRSFLSDFMTGLPNAAGYLDFAGNIQRNGKLMEYNAFYFNLKGFGLVNMKFGKDEADEILCRYSAILSDFILKDECVGRLGGDNFVALIRKERTHQFLNLIENIETYAFVAGHMITVNIPSVTGVYEIDEELKDKDYGQLISRTSVALNAAKNVTKKPYMFLTKEMNQRVIRQKQIRAKFRPALMNGEFHVYYQPKVETDTYSVAGAEALVRWISGGKVISPGEFIPLIEEDGTVCDLDFYMLGRVCHDINIWKSQGIEPVRVSVNFSRKHLRNPDFPQQIIDMS